MADALEVGGAFRLRQHDSVETRLDDRGEVVEREPGIERVNAHEERPRPRARAVEQRGDMRARPGFLRGATESSRSRISASAPHGLAPFANLRSESPGTNSIDLSFIGFPSVLPLFARGEDGVNRRNEPRDQALKVFDSLKAAIREEGSAALVSVVASQGSAPRERGARMVVRPSGAFHGTIGGGALEWEAMAAAAAALARGRGPLEKRALALGPQLGQCCGGRVSLTLETFDARDLAELDLLAEAEALGPFATRNSLGADGRLRREAAEGAGDESFGEAATPVFLFGAGHVGRALVLALAPLPFHVRWIDSRADAFPRFAPAKVERVEAADPAAEIDAAPDGAFVVVMTHSHPLDLDIVARALGRERFGYVGLIGSAAKRARFVSQMRAAGISQVALERLVCPIGVAGIDGKEPAVIAAGVAAQMLQARSTAAHRNPPIAS